MLTIGEISLDLDGRNAYRSGQLADLTAKEFDMIEFLMRNPNRVYSRENLLDMGALSVKTAVLVEKVLPRPEGLTHADWAGFFMDDRYLIGCGMDSEEKYRQYPGIAVMR